MRGPGSGGAGVGVAAGCTGPGNPQSDGRRGQVWGAAAFRPSPPAPGHGRGAPTFSLSARNRYLAHVRASGWAAPDSLMCRFPRVGDRDAETVAHACLAGRAAGWEFRGCDLAGDFPCARGKQGHVWRAVSLAVAAVQRRKVAAT